MTVSRKTILAIAGIAAFAGAASLNTAPAVANDSAAEAIEARHTLFEQMGDSMKALAGVARGQVEPNKAAMLRHARRIQTNSRRIQTAFALDTRRSGIENDALPAIWTARSDFNSKAQALTTASGRLVSAVDSGEMSQFGAAVGAVGQTCKDCHDTYRAD